MAGSLTYRSYVSDGGVAYTVKVDKSNADAIAVSGAGVSNGTVLLTVRNANAPLLPIGGKMRYANCTNTNNPNQKRRFYFGTGSAASLATDGATIVAPAYPTANDASPGPTTVWKVNSVRGEKFRKAPDFNSPDTGLTDGTIPQ
jgi:hypothetical protein